MGIVLWIVGEPGLGKTTLARSLLGEVRLLVAHPKWTIGTAAHAAGHYEDKPFDGADTIGYADGLRTLEAWNRDFIYRSAPWEGLTILDGDRLSNAKCVEFFKNLSSPPRLFSLLLVGPPELGRRRRAERAAGGKLQNETWLKGRVTKSRNFHETFEPIGRATLHADEGSKAEVAARTRRWIDLWLTTNP